MAICWRCGALTLDKDVFTYAEVAEMTGLGVRTIGEKVRSGEIASVYWLGARGKLRRGLRLQDYTEWAKKYYIRPDELSATHPSARVKRIYKLVRSARRKGLASVEARKQRNDGSIKAERDAVKNESI